MPEMTRQEWRWLILASLLLMVFSSVPYLVGLVSAGEGWAFGGFLLGLEDMHSYLAKMRLGARGGWQFQILYTLEPHRGGLLFPFHLALGKLTAAFSGLGGRVPAAHLVIAYHGARIVFGLAACIATYLFCAKYLPHLMGRRLAWFIICAGGGLGWLMLAFPVLDSPGGLPIPVDFYLPEAFTWLLLLSFPHLAAARALLLIGWLLLFNALENGQWPPALAAGLAWAGMSLIVPFFAALLGVLIAAWLGALALYQRRIPWTALGLASATGGPSALLLIYFGQVFARDAVMAAWSAQNILPSPPLIDYMLAYGLLLLLGVLGVVWLLRHPLKAHHLLLMAWPVVSFGLVYAPINVQRRLLEGVIVPLSILAVLGLFNLLGKLHPGVKRWQPLIIAGLLILLSLPVLLLVLGGAAQLSRPAAPRFISCPEQAALDWLRLNAPDDAAVLATFDAANALPAYAPVRVYAGHGPETIDARQKAALAARFFNDAGFSDAQRARLLAEAGIDYVWAGPAERDNACPAQTCFDPEALGLMPVYAADVYIIYEVRP